MTATPKAPAQAIKLHAAGYWVVPIYPPGARLKDKLTTGKEPIGKDWGSSRQDLDKLHAAFRRFPEAGIGIALGPDRGPRGTWLIDIEGDGPAAADSLARLLAGDVQQTPGWSSTRGDHTLFTADGPRLLELLDRAGASQRKGAQSGVFKLPELPELEFRVGGMKPDGSVKQLQSVVPPTPGTDGQPRRWTVTPATPVAPLPHAAYDLLDRLAEARQAGEGALKPMPTPPPPTEGDPVGRGSPGHKTRPTPEERATKYLATIEPAIAGSGGHDKTFAAACRVGPGFDLPPEITLRLLRDHYNPRCEPPWSDAELEHKVNHAYAAETERGWLLRTGKGRGNGSAPSNGHAHDGQDRRPAIELTTERHEVIDQTLRALTADPDLFHCGDALGTVITQPSPRGLLPAGVDDPGYSRFLPLAEPNLSCYLTKNATFFRFKDVGRGDLKEPMAVNGHPPDWLTHAIHRRREWPGIRRLTAIRDSPFIRDDGSLLAPGFDEATGTLYKPTGSLPALKPRPCRKDAQDAAQALYEVFHQFPFENGFSWAVWLAGLLTAIQRPLIGGGTPGFAFIGNQPGTGKGLLIDAIGILTWGHSIPTRSYPRDPVEAAKVKLSIALAAKSAVHFDNLEQGSLYGSTELDSALTSPIAEGRVLGQSHESGPVPLTPVWFLSGNNIAAGWDAPRRWLPCRLVTNLETPWLRADIQITDLRAHTHHRRPELLGHALTILRAHALANRPAVPDEGGLGSFDRWDRIVRGAVHFATGTDCLATQKKAYQEGAERADRLALLEGWAELPEGGPDGAGLTVEEAIKHTEDRPEVFTMLRSALIRISRDGKMPTPRQVGNRIRGINGANFDGKMFQKRGERNRYALWRVVKA
jgi:bifunctional DNA primase/polymerase-like protein